MERQQSIDLLKIIAMFGVISLHATMSYINPGTTGLADIIYDLGVISVPIFFMVSGFFLIPHKRDTKYFLKKTLNYIRFIITIVILGWAGYSMFFGIDFSILYKWLLGTLLTHGPFGVFWYLWAVILCLLITPLLNNLFIGHNQLYNLRLFGLWIVCTFFFSDTLQGGQFEQNTPALFKIYTWIFFYMLGGALSRIDIKINITTPLLLFAFGIFYIEYFGKKIGIEYVSFFYLSIPVTALCTAIFLFFKGISIQDSKAIRELSQIFLPVYAVHNVFIEFVPRFYNNLYLAPLINWIIISVLSVIFGLVVSKIPYINKLFKT